MKQSVKIFAHRGASGHAFENSFKAFNEAIIQKADGIEIDLQCSKDGQIFVFHDIHLKRLTGINRFFYDCLAEEITEYRLGRRFLRRFTSLKIPTIEEMIAWNEQYQIPLNVELKESLLTNSDALIAWLKNVELPEGSHFSSFYPELLKIVKEIRPEFETAILVKKNFNWNELDQLEYVDSIHANKKYYNQKYLNAAEVAGKKMRFYAITGNEDFIKNAHPVVIGWITDYPQKLARAIGRK
jgi:glycerophosphoryl diester phosphodiesterase